MAAAGEEHVTLDDGIVILADAGLDGGRVDTGGRGNNAVAVFGIVDPALDHLGDGQLVIDLECLGCIFGCFRQIER